MIRATPVFAAIVFVAACGEADEGLLGTDSRPLRSPCDTVAALMYFDARVGCMSDFPGSPVSPDPRFWHGEQPCKRTIEYAEETGFGPIDSTYDYSKPIELEGAKYDAAGNIVEWDVSGATGDPRAKIIFEYEEDRLARARLEPAELSAFGEFVVKYESGRKVREEAIGLVYHYVYDADGRLLAEGPPVGGRPPEPYARSFLAPDEAGELPKVPPIPGGADPTTATAPFFVYFYNDENRLETIGRAYSPGNMFSRADYRYEDGKLIEVSSISTAIEPAFRSQKWTYDYTCE